MDAKNLKIKRWFNCMKKVKDGSNSDNELNAVDTTYLSQVHSPFQNWIGRNELRIVSLIIRKA